MKWSTILLTLGALSTQTSALALDTRDSSLEARDFDGKVSCGNAPTGDRKRIQDGIDYLNGVGGTPAEHPNTCGRVSCSYESAIYMCNWNDEMQYLKSFKTLASGAQKILDECESMGLSVSGKVVAPNGWGVEIGYGSC